MNWTGYTIPQAAFVDEAKARDRRRMPIEVATNFGESESLPLTGELEHGEEAINPRNDDPQIARGRGTA